MLYRIGTVKEIRSLYGKFHEDVIEQLHYCTRTLDEAYGSERDYLQAGGYSLIAETADETAILKASDT